MTSPHSQSSGRRRGPRRRRPQDGEREASASVQKPPQAKPTFLQRVLAFFGFGPKKKTYPAYEGGKRKAGEAPARTPAQPPRPARKPEAIEVTSPKLYVGNLSFDAAESDLSELFNGVGGVRNAEIVTHRDTEKSKGFGFVTMNSVEEAKRAVEELHDKEFMGRRLVVSGAKTNERVAA
ncbi:MAG: hypothetical protein RLZZ399_779 [Verrucomicrobiota bacterium]